MAKVDLLKMLYAKKISPENFSWDRIVSPKPLLALISMQDIAELYKIATSIKLSSKPKIKYQYIDNILTARGFKKLASGTNRVVYKYLEDQSIVLKIAIDKVGLKDNPAEYKNQYKLKPFCTKMFEVSPCGTVALVERVEPITSREEFIAVAPNVFNMITNKIIGKYVLDDIGTKYFMNYGIRVGMGPVLLDYPYVYDIDGAKLYCNKVFDPGSGTTCGGAIDYDDGFNKLICEKCGKEYFPLQLKKDVDNEDVVIEKEGGRPSMAIKLMRGNECVEEFNTVNEVDTLPVKERRSITDDRASDSGIRIKGYKRFQERQENKLERSNKKNDSYNNRNQDQHREKCPVQKNDYHKEQPKKEDYNSNISAKDYGGNVDKKIFTNPKMINKEEEKKSEQIVNEQHTKSTRFISREDVKKEAEVVYSSEDKDTGNSFFADIVLDDSDDVKEEVESSQAETEVVDEEEVISEDEVEVVDINSSDIVDELEASFEEDDEGGYITLEDGDESLGDDGYAVSRIEMED